MPSGNVGPTLQLGPGPHHLPLPGPSHCGDCWSLCILYSLEGEGPRGVSKGVRVCAVWIHRACAMSYVCMCGNTGIGALCECKDVR